jgi:hypothetical protein
MRHFHYFLIAHNKERENGQFDAGADLDVIAGGENEAIDIARTLIDRAYYRVVKVIEHSPAIEEPAMQDMLSLNHG